MKDKIREWVGECIPFTTPKHPCKVYYFGQRKTKPNSN